MTDIKKIYDNNNHLNKCDILLTSNVILHTNKILSNGTFSTCFLGQDKLSGIKVIILRIDLTNFDKFIIEDYVLKKFMAWVIFRHCMKV